MLRSRIVVPRRLANGNVAYWTGRIAKLGWRNTASACGIGGPACGGGRRHQRDANVSRQQTADEIVHVTFEPAETMERVHRSREHGNAQRLTFTRSHSASGAGAAMTSR